MELERRDVHLDVAEPVIIVRASVAKNHKMAAQRLTPELVGLLRLHLGTDGNPTDKVFKPDFSRIRVFKRDLKAARIDYVDANGEYADFHSLRKTYATMLHLAGVHPRVVMELMRHSDMKLTTKTYTDARMLPVRDAVLKLPTLMNRINQTPE